MLRRRNAAGGEGFWIPAFAGMTGGHRSLAINSRISNYVTSVLNTYPYQRYTPEVKVGGMIR